ncbi:MAG: carbamoyltransferase HypF [Terriglobales bacterium]|jgi:hydrogenase maturation protein HypF
MEVRRQIEVSGIVQGVGFRPYVYRLATGRHLRGTIRNTSAGVTIEIQGPAETVQDFVEHLPAEAPPLARITGFTVNEVPCVALPIGDDQDQDQDFRIIHSREGEEVRTLISPDVAICSDCLREMFDSNDRRYRYPFINCTNCGPRFTIIRDIPYDRPSTSMAMFQMCPACLAEYQNPLDRRFHAQPNACWECGPRVELWDKSGKRIECRDPITEAVSGLHAGLVVAVKGLGGFHLAVDATNPASVALLRRRKRRVQKPFAVMVPDLQAAREICELDDASRTVLESIQRPIVLLEKKTPNRIPDEVAPFNRYLGVFLPYTPLHYLLFAEGGFTALVMTSGNLSEEPIAIDNREAIHRLHGLADYFLVHNRDILLRSDDSVVRVAGGVTRHLRRSRGFVPVPVFLKDDQTKNDQTRNDQPSVLAVGGELKNTICLTKGKHAFLSQHIGDLENAESYSFFHEAIQHLERILEIRPAIIAYDLHPDYFSTRWALQQRGAKLVGVQHHHAHIASCMAENHLEGRVIGFALDGTGYGTDGNIWGGEVLLAGYESFERAAHFEYVPLPGGAAAIREPWRMAVSYLAHHFGREFLNLEFMKLDIPFVRQLNRSKVELLLRMMEQGVNSPLTSSCGRLFDAVAALIGIRQQINYEAQAAIELEMAIASSEIASPEKDTFYAMKLLPEPMPENNHWIISTRPLFEALLDDLSRNLPVGAISRRFHNGLIEGFVDLATLLREKNSLHRVCLSGGTFHNVYLSERLERRLSEAGFEVFTQKEVPSGDGGLSLGQALVATAAANLHA